MGSSEEESVKKRSYDSLKIRRKNFWHSLTLALHHLCNLEAKTILTPILTELRKHREEHNYEKVSEFYDVNAVHVHAGKEAVYGKDAILEHSKKFIDRSGKLTPKLSNEKFGMAGDFIIFTADYETETEKIGVLKGKFTQIWRKTNDTYLILHIEYAPQ